MIIARSPVFSAMFHSEMLESTQNSVRIEDFPDEIVQGMLEFIYTGRTTDSLKENAVDLLRIGDKYGVLGLKENCERIILRNLNVENAAEILVLAHLHSSAALKAKIVTFIHR